MSPADLRYEARREAVPAVVAALAVLVVLAVVSRREGWEVLQSIKWWTWLLLAVPEALLLLDLAGLVRVVASRRIALVLLGILVAGNLASLGILVAGLVSTSTKHLSGGELLLTGAALWVTNVIVFGLWFWEIDDGGPVARSRPAHRRTKPDFQFSQDDNPQLAQDDWSPQVWDYLYVSLTNSIAFSPTDAMPLSRHAKALMALGSLISVVAVLLVAARAVNVLGA